MKRNKRQKEIRNDLLLSYKYMDVKRYVYHKRNDYRYWCNEVEIIKDGRD